MVLLVRCDSTSRSIKAHSVRMPKLKSFPIHMHIYTLYTVYTFRFLHFKFAQHVEVINHFACSTGKGERGGRGSRGRVRKLIHFWGPKQNEYFLYFLRNTGHKIDVTFVLALEKYGRNMAALGSSCQAEFAHPFPLLPATVCSVCAQKLAMKNSSASRNDISI